MKKALRCRRALIVGLQRGRCVRPRQLPDLRIAFETVSEDFRCCRDKNLSSIAGAVPTVLESFQQVSCTHSSRAWRLGKQPGRVLNHALGAAGWVSVIHAKMGVSPNRESCHEWP